MSRKGRGPNQVLETYMKDLKWKLFWMSGAKKKLLIDETRAHLEDLAHDIGGEPDEAYEEAIKRFGSATQIARQYKHRYGYGKKFTAVMVVVAMFLAGLTLPIISNIPPIGEKQQDRDNIEALNTCCGVNSVIFTILTFVVIIFAGIKGGKWVGLIVGGSAFITRSFILILWQVVFTVISNFVTEKLQSASGMNLALDITLSGGQVCGIMFISALMLPAGFFAGRALKKLRKEEIFGGK